MEDLAIHLYYGIHTKNNLQDMSLNYLDPM